MADFEQFKRTIEDFERDDRPAAIYIKQDGETHAMVTIMPAGPGAPGRTIRVEFTEPDAILNTEERIQGIIDEMWA